MSAKRLITSEVRMRRGAPALFLNGRPHSGLTYFRAKVMGSGGDIRAFARAGVHLFSGCFNALLREDGTRDLAAADEWFESALAANPELLILPRVTVTA